MKTPWITSEALTKVWGRSAAQRSPKRTSWLQTDVLSRDVLSRLGKFPRKAKAGHGWNLNPRCLPTKAAAEEPIPSGCWNVSDNLLIPTGSMPGSQGYSKCWHWARQHRWEGGILSPDISGATLCGLMWYSRTQGGRFWFVFQPNSCCCPAEKWHRITGLDGTSGGL